MTPRSVIADLLRAVGLSQEGRVADQTPDQPKRKQRLTRARRADSGKKIVFRVSNEEWDALHLEAGDIGISTLVRARVFGGGIRSRDGLRRIAALHLIGRRLQMLTEHPGMDVGQTAATLTEVRTAIARLSKDIPSADADDDTVS